MHAALRIGSILSIMLMVAVCSSAPEPPPSIDVFENQFWSHQGAARATLLVVAPDGLRPVQAELTERASGETVTLRLKQSTSSSSTCYSQDIELEGSIFETTRGVVIAQGALTKRKSGPKLGTRYEITVVLEDSDGNQQTASGTHRGLCSVVTE